MFVVQGSRKKSSFAGCPTTKALPNFSPKTFWTKRAIFSPKYCIKPAKNYDFANRQHYIKYVLLSIGDFFFPLVVRPLPPPPLLVVGTIVEELFVIRLDPKWSYDHESSVHVNLVRNNNKIYWKFCKSQFKYAN